MLPSLWDWGKRLTLSDYASIASLIGLALTVWVALSVRKIRAFYLFTGRVPELARRLKQHASMLANHLNDFDASREKAREELVAADVTVQSLQRKVGGQLKKTLKDLSVAIRRGNRSGLDPATARAIYLLMIHANAQLKDLQSDLKWEK